jgi:hypothetical protein
MKNAVRRAILEQIDRYYDTYKLVILTDSVFDLPKHLYEQPGILLNAGNKLKTPTVVSFRPRFFYLMASFELVKHDLKIPYDNLVGIWDFDMKKGIYFMSGPPVTLVHKDEIKPLPKEVN